MSVQVKLSTTLRQYVPAYAPGQDFLLDAAGQTAASLAGSLGLPAGEIKFAMINGRLGKMGDVLKDGDRIAYFPAVGGG